MLQVLLSGFSACALAERIELALADTQEIQKTDVEGLQRDESERKILEMHQPYWFK